MPETQGETMPNKQLVEMLLRSRLFRDYENVFTKATGLPLALRPLEVEKLGDVCGPITNIDPLATSRRHGNRLTTQGPQPTFAVGTV